MQKKLSEMIASFVRCEFFLDREPRPSVRAREVPSVGERGSWERKSSHNKEKVFLVEFVKQS